MTVLGEIMDARKKLTKEDKELIQQLALAGEKLHIIASQLSIPVSKQRVKQITQQLGIDSFKIRQTSREQDKANKMFKKYGAEWANKKHRQSLIYQEMRAKFRAKKANAKRAGVEFTLDFCDLDFPTRCPILDIELNYFAEERAENSVSFDRVDAEQGYVKGNVVIISWRANRIKNNGTAKEHRQIAEFIDSWQT